MDNRVFKKVVMPLPVTQDIVYNLTKRTLYPGEGDNVDKANDVAERIKEHLSSVVSAVNAGDLGSIVLSSHS